MAQIVSLNISETTGTGKQPVSEAVLREEHGMVGDAHARNWHRQISLLAQESIDKMIAKGLDLNPGDFAENITISGLSLVELPIGTRLRVGSGPVELEISQIGKKCHAKCNIFQQVGDCVMPREGVFARVVSGGTVHVGDEITVVGSPEK